MTEKYCDEHACLKNEIDHLKEDTHEMRDQLKAIAEEIKALGTHEKIFVAFVGFLGIALSAGGSILGTLIVSLWGK